MSFSHRKINEGGVVASDSDELEGRFPAGKANLCTSSLYYDALLSAAYLAEDLGKGTAIIKKYRKQAEKLEKAIDSYFATKWKDLTHTHIIKEIIFYVHGYVSL